MTPATDAALGTILAATDFSPTADVAVAAARRIAVERGSRLILTHVCSLHHFAAGGPAPALSAELEEAVRSASERKLTEIAGSFEGDEIDIDTYFETGDPDVRILQLAEKSEADLVVLGTRGLSGLRHLILGSTAAEVVRGAPCPVLTLHESGPNRVEAPRVILVAHDFSAQSAEAVEVATRFYGGPDAGKVVLLHVYHLPKLLEPVLGDIEVMPISFDEIVEPLKEDLEPMAEKLRAAGFEVECRVAQGDPSAVITETAPEVGADLVVMGTHGRSGFKHMLLGSTAERVVQHAACPVLTVRKE